MKNDIISNYSKNILKPIENFIEQQEGEIYGKKKIVPIEQEKILEKTQELYLKKLEVFATICDAELQIPKQ